MKKISLFFAFLVSASSLSLMAQTKPAWNSIFASINKEVQENSNAYNSLKISSETIGHRLTGSENGKKAEQFAFDLLKSYGFTNLRFQPFEVESWSRGTLEVTIGGDMNNLKTIKSVSLAHSPVKVDLALEVVDMGNGVEEDYAANPNKVKGKIALVYLGVLPGSKPGTPGLHRSEKTAIATKYGASGVIIINKVESGVWKFVIKLSAILKS